MIPKLLSCNSLRFKHVIKMLCWSLFNLWNSTLSDQTLQGFARFFNVKKNRIFFFGSGRMGLFTFLKSLNLRDNDEIIVVGFTCVVVTNAIKYIKCNVRYVDIDEHTLNVDTNKLIAAINNRTKVIICSHNFGIIYEDIEKIKKLYPHVLVIEDAAPALGSKNKDNIKAGLIGDASFFSFEFSKTITTGMGGMLIINNLDILKNVQKIYAKIGYYPIYYNLKIFITLVYSLIMSYKYTIALDALLYPLLSRLSFFASTSNREVQGEMPKYYPIRLSKYLGYLGYLQLCENISEDNKLAQKYFNFLKQIPQIQLYYNENYKLVRFPIVFNKSVNPIIINKIIYRIKKEVKIPVGEWFNDVIHPKGSYRYKYISGSCEVGESITKRIINLPMNIHLRLTPKMMVNIINIFTEELSHCEVDPVFLDTGLGDNS